MSEDTTKEIVDYFGEFFGVNAYRLDTLIEVLIEKKVITKEEFNKVANNIMEFKKENPNSKADEIDKIKEKILLR
ncbi:hypothetical protein [Clostridium botulinum]|uniref:hypothetical protein n=1 Tax=Clostridium botulinum TaxID=1491 RepID=UPI003890F214